MLQTDRSDRTGDNSASGVYKRSAMNLHGGDLRCGESILRGMRSWDTPPPPATDRIVTRQERVDRPRRNTPECNRCPAKKQRRITKTVDDHSTQRRDRCHAGDFFRARIFSCDFVAQLYRATISPHATAQLHTAADRIDKRGFCATFPLLRPTFANRVRKL